MRAVVYSGYGIMPEVAEVADPACAPDGVVIAVGASGVCRSDWHAWKGHDPVDLPHIGGHELAGVIAQTGPEVTRWRAGDRVTVPFVCGCGRCEYCQAGDAQVCPRQTQPGFTGPGSFAELRANHSPTAGTLIQFSTQLRNKTPSGVFAVNIPARPTAAFCWRKMDRLEPLLVGRESSPEIAVRCLELSCQNVGSQHCKCGACTSK